MKRFTFKEIETNLLYFIDARDADEARRNLAINLQLRLNSIKIDFAIIKIA